MMLWIGVVLVSQPASTLAASSGLVMCGASCDLEWGMSGEEVRQLQTFLINRRQTIPAGATGYFGVQTRAALMAYQSASGITPVSGYFGPKTRAHILTLGVEGWW